MIELRVLDDLEAISREAVELCLASYSERRPLRIALSGGKTPGRAYEILASAALDWQDVEIYWVDERCVPPDNPDSNLRLARGALLDRTPIPTGNIHPMRGDIDPELAAAQYAKALDGVKLDFCFMGLGSDGHTASLFPGDDASLRSEELVLHTQSPVGVRDRLTLTPKALAKAGSLVFLVSGEDKRIPFQRFMAGEQLPSRYVAEHAKHAIVLADRLATGD